MAKPSETFNFTYALSVSNGTYTLLDSNPGSTGVDPVGIGVNITDTDGSATIDSADADLKIKNVASGSLSHGKYEFVATAKIGGHDGFIIEDHKGDYFYVTNTAYNGNLNNNHGQLKHVDPGGSIALCFMAGTSVATPDGSVAVENLSIGQWVSTADGRSAPVRWIGRQTVSRFFTDELRLPVCIRAHAIGEDMPMRDLLVSPGHALLVDGVLTQAGALVNDVSIVRARNVPAIFNYYHVELDDHSLILAENVPAETFVDHVERTHFDNWDEYQALYPDGRNVPEMEYPRAKAYRQVPRAIRERLAARGEALFGESVASAA
jgi:Hint domain